jgi:hypothetical protein
MISALALSSVVIVGMVLLQSFEHLPAAYSFEGFMFSRVAGSALSIIGLFAMRQQLLIPVQLGCLLWVILSHLWHLGRAATAGVQPALSSDPEP